jgi:hypothetical protein
MFLKLFGGVFNSEHCKVPQNIKQFFDSGGTAIDIRRIVHFTEPANILSRTSAKGSLNVTNEGASESAATVTSVGTFPLSLNPGDGLTVEIDGGGDTSDTVDATRAAVSSSPASWPVADQDGNTLTYRINQGAEKTITFASPATTQEEIRTQMNAQIEGGRAVIDTGEVKAETDRKGSGAYIQITGGTANAVLGYSTTEVQGTGDFADIENIQGAEFKTWYDAAFTGSSFSLNPTNTGTFTTTATGASASIQMKTSDIQTALNLDTTLHEGSDATPEDTITFQGKTEWDLAGVSVEVADASNGEAARFDIITYYNGAVYQRYRNYTMDSSDARYVVTQFNDDATGDDLLDAVDLDLVGGGMSVLNARPLNGTYSAFSGGDSGLVDLNDADFVGSAGGKTGLYAFDMEEDVKLISIPGRSSATIHASMHAYEDYRDHMVYMVHPTPDKATVGTAQEMKTFSQSNLWNQSEFGCCGWPRIGIPNLWTETFGTDEIIYVCPSMSKMGRFLYNDQNHPDEVFVSTAGVDNGTIPNVLATEVDDTKDEGLRDLIADVNIEPIWKEAGVYVFDGGDNLKTNGNWPRQWHARAVIFIVETLRRDAISMKHKKNTPKNRGEWERRGSDWLAGLPEDAFDPDADTFFQVDNENINPPEVRNQQEMVGLLGLGFSQDAKYVTIEVTRTLAG